MTETRNGHEHRTSDRTQRGRTRTTNEGASARFGLTGTYARDSNEGVTSEFLPLPGDLCDMRSDSLCMLVERHRRTEAFISWQLPRAATTGSSFRLATGDSRGQHARVALTPLSLFPPPLTARIAKTRATCIEPANKINA